MVVESSIVITECCGRFEEQECACEHCRSMVFGARRWLDNSLGNCYACSKCRKDIRFGYCLCATFCFDKGHVHACKFGTCDICWPKGTRAIVRVLQKQSYMESHMLCLEENAVMRFCSTHHYIVNKHGKCAMCVIRCDVCEKDHEMALYCKQKSSDDR